MGTERRTAQEGRSDKSWACDLEERRRTSGTKSGSLKCIVYLENDLINGKSYVRLINSSRKGEDTARIFPS